MGGKPVVLDDTVYFLPCRSEDEADFVHSPVQPKPYSQLLHGTVFAAEKGPITAEVLRRSIPLDRVQTSLDWGDRATCMRGKPEPQMELAPGP